MTRNASTETRPPHTAMGISMPVRSNLTTMQAPIPVTRKLALDLIADAIADHILAQIASAQAAPVMLTEPKAQTESAPKPKRAASKRKTLMTAPNK